MRRGLSHNVALRPIAPHVGPNTRLPHTTMRRSILFVTLALTAACNREPSLYHGADTGLALASSGRQKDSLIFLKDSLLAARQRQISEQSALIGDAATSARLMSEINGSLAKVRNLEVKRDTAQPESGVTTASSELATLQRKVDAVVARLNSAEARVRQMRQDRTKHAEWDSTQVTQLRTYERSIAELRAGVEQQQQEITMLAARVDSLSQANLVLASRNDSVVAVNRAMAARDDSVFVVIGTEQELRDKGIVRREGGTKFFFGRGKALVPARSLERSAFQVISKKRDLDITLPASDKEYQVVSRHDLAYTSASASKNQRVRGALQITDPERFWSSSKYLILVQR